jgi:A/G-specific adenine glycosylase
MMLQQTQVPRVTPKYKAFIKRFPTIRALAKAPLSEVLKEWSGLGYNRRAKYLHEAAKQLMLSSRGRAKIASADLNMLRGVGPYTRNAVRVFAFNEPLVLLETNIRTAFIHHFFPRKKNVTDKELLPLITRAAKGQDPREWHWALMDYGAYLKRTGVRNNQKSAHYVKQSKFEGSLRQIRGAVLRSLTTGGNLGLRNPNMLKALKSLERDGLVKKEKGKWRIA